MNAFTTVDDKLRKCRYIINCFFLNTSHMTYFSRLALSRRFRNIIQYLIRATEHANQFLLPLDGMLVHRRSLPRNLLGFPNNSAVPIHTHGWPERGTVTAKCLAQEHTSVWLEPGLLDPRTSALTIKATAPPW